MSSQAAITSGSLSAYRTVPFDCRGSTSPAPISTEMVLANGGFIASQARGKA